MMVYLKCKCGWKRTSEDSFNRRKTSLTMEQKENFIKKMLIKSSEHNNGMKCPKCDKKLFTLFDKCSIK